MKDLEYKVIIQKNEEEDGYWAYCPDLPGCNAIGENLPEVKLNMREAVAGYLEVLASLQKEIPPAEERFCFYRDHSRGGLSSAEQSWRTAIRLTSFHFSIAP